jgi:protein TonB
LDERFDLGVLKERKRTDAVGISILVSAVIHILLVICMVRSYQPVRQAVEDVPIARYVELMRQNPDTFVEAPGPEVEKAPITAPLSNANRRASSPQPPTGNTPTPRPGEGGGLYVPPESSQQPRPRQPAAAAAVPPQPQSVFSQAESMDAKASGGLVYRPEPTAAMASAAIDWQSAIREVAKAQGGEGSGLDMGSLAAGEKGFWEQGPLSFETQWYDWGDYAQSMVSRIRVNWYANMPQLIRTGMKGVVTIRFTIRRDGRITDVTIINSSGVPPYDHAAKKAIELSSPLAALPADFPNSSERVTATFYYNTPVPGR